MKGWIVRLAPGCGYLGVSVVCTLRKRALRFASKGQASEAAQHHGGTVEHAWTMRVVAAGDFVTWGRGQAAFRVVTIAQQGVYVDGTHCDSGICFVPWVGDGGARPVRHVCGDRIDYLLSFATRES